MKFEKWQGTGNDFVVVMGDQFESAIDAEMAKELCDRHFGIGADGVLVLTRNGNSGAMKIYNADGTVAEMCGNGIRIAAAVLGSDVDVIRTDGGDMYPQIAESASPDRMIVRVAMGKATVIDRELMIPIRHQSSGVEKVFQGTSISMGNPHFVIFEDPNDENVLQWGPRLEVNESFPNRSNIEFIEVKDRHRIRMRVWERGVGETLACGTGACASAVATILAGLAESPVTVDLPGGDLKIEVDDDLLVHMTGEARRVFSGSVESIR